MKRFLYLLTLVLAGVLSLGFFLGWFAVTAGMVGDRFTITFSVDRDKFQTDEHTALERVPGGGQPGQEPAAPAVGPPPKPE